MNKFRILAATLCTVMALGMSACSAELTNSDLQKQMDKNDVMEFSDLGDLSAERILWEPGRAGSDSEGRPISCIQSQKKYGKYDADFIRLGKEFENKVYLTIDAGYENTFTNKILDILKEKDVPTVFFITLEYAEQEPELVQRMIDEGHIVGNHTASHPNMAELSAKEGFRDVMKLHNYMKENFGYEMHLFRFPEGVCSEQDLAMLQKIGYKW